MVGAMSTAWTYWSRGFAWGSILPGQATMHMSAVPPSSPAHRFQYGNGVSKAQAQPVL